MGSKRSDSSIAQTFLGHDSYILRPYFLSTLARARDWSKIQRASSLRAYLDGDFLEREAALVEDNSEHRLK